MMFISVIIPTLNEESYIGDLLDFLTKHPQKNQFEVIVVDGQSDDQTAEIVKSYNVALHFANASSRALQMNTGAKHAVGDIFYFVHADVQLVSSFVDDILKAEEQGFNSGCFRFRFVKPSNPLLYINGFFTRFPFEWCRGGDQTLFITREAFDRVDGFDESYVIMEDYDLLSRLKKNSVPFKIIPKSVQVSSRKYEANSYLKVQMANLKAMKMYRKGFNPKEIKDFYMQALN